MKHFLILVAFLSLSVFSCSPNLNGRMVSTLDGNSIVTENGKKLSISGYDEEEISVFYLVRHAEKETGSDPGLTEAGTIRAKKLGKMLESVQLKTIYSTNKKRTINTAAPTAELQKLSVDSYDHKKQEDLIKGLIPDKGKRFLIVGHSNTIPNLLNLFQSKKVYDHIDESEYDNFYIVIAYGPGDAKIIELKY